MDTNGTLEVKSENVGGLLSAATDDTNDADDPGADDPPPPPQLETNNKIKRVKNFSYIN